VTPEQIAEVWSMVDRDALVAIAQRGPAPVFATISGAHLYGFASPDSDIDLRGAFLTPLAEMVGLFPPDETLTMMDDSVYDLDWVAHDVRKFARMMVQDNGYVLEQLYSPLVVIETPALAELRAIGRGCVTRPTVRHYRGFARGRRKRLHEPHPTVKHLLYAYRVFLSGMHLMRTGEVVSHLTTLNSLCGLPIIDELVERKRAGAEKMALGADELALHDRHLDRLEAELTEAFEASRLPLEASAETVAALQDLVLRLRLATASDK
jgi:uncharacterized protein